MSQRSALYFVKRKTLCKTNKPIGVFVDKFIDNNCGLRHLVEFIQTHLKKQVF